MLIGLCLLLWLVAGCGSASQKQRPGQSDEAQANTSGSEAQPEGKGENPSRAERAPVVQFDQLQQRLQDTEGKTLYVNFWATWCKPCVEELPYFLEMARQHQDFNLLLVSLDFPQKRESQLLPFLKARGIEQEVVLLEQPNGGDWINTIAPQWSGSIPATLVVNSERQIRDFYGKPFEKSELVALYQQYQSQTPNP